VRERKNSFFLPLSVKKSTIHQDRLGTNAGKTQKGGLSFTHAALRSSSPSVRGTSQAQVWMVSGGRRQGAGR